MYMKVFPHGQGTGEGPTNYLVRADYPGRNAHLPDVLRGDPEVTRALIDSLDTKWRFTAGVLSWHPDDTVTTEQEQRVMDDFETLAFAGLEIDQRNILWVRHVHAGHHELHFVIPRVELSSGKAFNPCPPGWQKHFDLFRDLHNYREGWARPDDSTRTRLYTPAHTDLHRARLLRWGKTPKPDDRTAAKDAIHEYMQAKVEQGQASTRAEVLTALQEAGLEINRIGKNYISVKDPDSGEKLRLKGGMYAEHWNFGFFLGRTVENEGRTGAAGNGEPDPTTIQRLERELTAVIAKRAEYNRSRYPCPTWEFGKLHRLPQPDVEPHLWLDMPAGSASEPEHSVGRGAGWLGPDDLGGEICGEPAGGNQRTSDNQKGLGENPCLMAPDVKRRPQRAIRSTEASAYIKKRMVFREPTRMETGVTHDRTGTNAQRIAGAHGTAFARHADSPRPNLTTAQQRIGTDKEGNSGLTDRTANPDCALDSLESCVRELTALISEVERAAARQIDRLRAQGERMRRKILRL